MSALETQVGGGHYKDMKIQPVEFIHANKIPFIEGNAITYICRHRLKGGAQDIRKAIHMLEQLIELEYGGVPTPEAAKAHEAARAIAEALKHVPASPIPQRPPGLPIENIGVARCPFCGEAYSANESHLCVNFKNK